MDFDVMLCDHAQVAGGKLFVSGASIDSIVLPPGSVPPFLVNFAAAGLVHVPWTATNTEHSLSFELLNQDGGSPLTVEEEPFRVEGEMRFNVGRPPDVAAGSEQLVPFAFNFQAVPLGSSGRYTLRFCIDGTEMRRVNVNLIVQPSPGYMPSAS